MEQSKTRASRLMGWEPDTKGTQNNSQASIEEREMHSRIAFALLSALSLSFAVPIGDTQDDAQIAKRQAATHAQEVKNCIKPGLIALVIEGGSPSAKTIDVANTLVSAKSNGTFLVQAPKLLKNGYSNRQKTQLQSSQDMGMEVGLYGSDSKTVFNIRSHLTGATGYMFYMHYKSTGAPSSSAISDAGYTHIVKPSLSLGHVAGSTRSIDAALKRVTDYLTANINASPIISFKESSAGAAQLVTRLVNAANTGRSFVSMSECIGTPDTITNLPQKPDTGALPEKKPETASVRDHKQCINPKQMAIVMKYEDFVVLDSEEKRVAQNALLHFEDNFINTDEGLDPKLHFGISAVTGRTDWIRSVLKQDVTLKHSRVLGQFVVSNGIVWELKYLKRFAASLGHKHVIQPKSFCQYNTLAMKDALAALIRENQNGGLILRGCQSLNWPILLKFIKELGLTVVPMHKCVGLDIPKPEIGTIDGSWNYAHHMEGNLSYHTQCTKPGMIAVNMETYYYLNTAIDLFLKKGVAVTVPVGSNLDSLPMNYPRDKIQFILNAKFENSFGEIHNKFLWQFHDSMVQAKINGTIVFTESAPIDWRVSSLINLNYKYAVAPTFQFYPSRRDDSPPNINHLESFLVRNPKISPIIYISEWEDNVLEKAINGLINLARKRGLKFVTIDQCLGIN